MPPVPAIRQAPRVTASAAAMPFASVLNGFARLFRSATQPGGGGRVMTSEQLYREMFSAGQMTESGALVTDDNIMTVGEIFACLRILSSSIAMLPLNLVAYDGDREEIASDHPVQSLLSRGPNRRHTPFEFIQMAITHKLLYGNFYALVTRSMDRVIEIWPLNPRRVQVEELADGTLVYKYSTPKGEPVAFFEHEILHLRGLSKDGILGESTAYAAREDAGLGMRMRTFAGSLFKNGLRPSGVYKVPTMLTEEQFAQAKAILDSYMSGAENAGKTLLLQGGAEWSKISLDAQEAQMIEARQFTRSQVAMFFGVPPQFLGDLAGSTTWGSGMAQQGKGFVSFVLNPHIISLCQALDKALLSPEERDRYYHRIDTRMLTEGDAKDRASVHEIYIRNKVMNPNEVRSEIGLNPREGGDKYEAPPAKPAAALLADLQKEATAQMSGRPRASAEKPVICLDFNGVVHRYSKGWQEGAIYDDVTEGFFEWAEKAVKLFRLVICSAKADKAGGLKAMRVWMKEQHQKWADAQGIAADDLPFEFTNVKPPAFLTIDDRAMQFAGSWDAFEPETLLKFEPWYRNA